MNTWSPREYSRCKLPQFRLKSEHWIQLPHPQTARYTQVLHSSGTCAIDLCMCVCARAGLVYICVCAFMCRGQSSTGIFFHSSLYFIFIFIFFLGKICYGTWTCCFSQIGQPANPGHPPAPIPTELSCPGTKATPVHYHSQLPTRVL